MEVKKENYADDMIINLGNRRTYRQIITTKKRTYLLGKWSFLKNQ